MKYVLSFLVMFASTWASASSFMPENTLHLYPPETESSMTEEEFSKIIDDIMAVYVPEAKKFGYNLIVDKLWKNNTVNAYASEYGTTWKVAMFGGLARRPEVTADGFALVVCHELGHHMGGYPAYPGEWASSEGNSDYWATQACARRVWGNSASKQLNEEAVDSVDHFAKAKCDQAWSLQGDRSLCYRIANASHGLAKLLGGGTTPEFNTPDTTVVRSTYFKHPNGQCRLDTYFAGGLCLTKHRNNFIPGRWNPNGQDGVLAQNESLGNSCGNRPKCWFKAL